MCLLNTSGKPASIATVRYVQGTKSFTSGREITTGKTFPLSGSIDMPANYMLEMELK